MLSFSRDRPINFALGQVCCSGGVLARSGPGFPYARLPRWCKLPLLLLYFSLRLGPHHSRCILVVSCLCSVRGRSSWQTLSGACGRSSTATAHALSSWYRIGFSPCFRCLRFASILCSGAPLGPRVAGFALSPSFHSSPIEVIPAFFSVPSSEAILLQLLDAANIPSFSYSSPGFSPGSLLPCLLSRRTPVTSCPQCSWPLHLYMSRLCVPGHARFCPANGA